MKLATSTTLRRRAAGLLAAAVALPLALSLAVPGAAVAAAPLPTQDVEAQATGATVVGQTYLTDRLVRVFISSPAMRTTIPVDVILPQTYASDPTSTYPTYYLLDGFRVPDDRSDWEFEAQAQDFFKDKNVLAVTAVGGAGSFYTNWNRTDPNAGVQGTQKWEDFFTREVPDVLQTSFRANTAKAVGGLSMGATAAMAYATRFPAAYRAVASFSGYLHTTGPYMPELIKASITQNIPFNPDNMWGPSPAQDPAWAAHDPFVQSSVNVAALKQSGVKLYVSAGDGSPGPYDGPGLFGLSSNYIGSILEIIARYSSQEFVAQAGQLGLTVQTDLQGPGTHSWPYWKEQLSKSWPTVAAALGTPVGGVACSTDGNFSTIARVQLLGDCTSAPYTSATGSGLVQDFDNGRAYLNGSAVSVVRGSIGAKYQQLGAERALGLPLTTETGVAGGAFNDFAAGSSIYWSPATGAQQVGGSIRDRWNALGGAAGQVGFPTSDEFGVTSSIDGAGARVSRFQNGNIYYVPGAAPQPGIRSNFWIHGGIFTEWGNRGFEAGRLGLPLSEEVPVPGGVQVTFQGGTIGFINGGIVVTLR